MDDQAEIVASPPRKRNLLQSAAVTFDSPLRTSPRVSQSPIISHLTNTEFNSNDCLPISFSQGLSPTKRLKFTKNNNLFTKISRSYRWIDDSDKYRNIFLDSLRINCTYCCAWIAGDRECNLVAHERTNKHIRHLENLPIEVEQKSPPTFGIPVMEYKDTIRKARAIFTAKAGSMINKSQISSVYSTEMVSMAKNLKDRGVNLGVAGTIANDVVLSSCMIHDHLKDALRGKLGVLVVDGATSKFFQRKKLDVVLFCSSQIKKDVLIKILINKVATAEQEAAAIEKALEEFLDQQTIESRAVSGR